MSIVTSFMTYTSISYQSYEPDIEHNCLNLVNNNILLASDTPHKVSYSAPSNVIYVEATPNSSISYFEVRVTAIDAAYGIGVGVKAYSRLTAAGSADPLDFEISVNSTNFPSNNLQLTPAFRVSFYAKRYSDGIWDVTYLLIDKDLKIVVPQDNDTDGIEVIDDQPIPND